MSLLPISTNTKRTKTDPNKASVQVRSTYPILAMPSAYYNDKQLMETMMGSFHVETRPRNAPELTPEPDLSQLVTEFAYGVDAPREKGKAAETPETVDEELADICFDDISSDKGLIGVGFDEECIDPSLDDGSIGTGFSELTSYGEGLVGMGFEDAGFSDVTRFANLKFSGANFFDEIEDNGFADTAVADLNTAGIICLSNATNEYGSCNLDIHGFANTNVAGTNTIDAVPATRSISIAFIGTILTDIGLAETGFTDADFEETSIVDWILSRPDVEPQGCVELPEGFLLARPRIPDGDTIDLRMLSRKARPTMEQVAAMHENAAKRKAFEMGRIEETDEDSGEEIVVPARKVVKYTVGREGAGY